jgi:3-oxoadipate enol-lactonase
LQFVRVNDIVVHTQTIEAAGARPALVFVNSLGTDLRIWQATLAHLAGGATALTYDLRGHGLTDVGRTPYTIATLANDLAALMDHAGVRSAIVCGISLGGLVAQQLHAARPDLVEALVLCNTAAKIGEASLWNARIAAIEAGGMAAVADSVLARWFAPDYKSKRPTEFAGYRNMLIRQPVDGYIAACAALATADLTAYAEKIDVPTLCITGDMDSSIPPQLMADLARSIPGARLDTIGNCGHLPCIEQPERLAGLLRAFVAHVGMEMASHVSY